MFTAGLIGLWDGWSLRFQVKLTNVWSNPVTIGRVGQPLGLWNSTYNYFFSLCIYLYKYSTLIPSYRYFSWAPLRADFIHEFWRNRFQAMKGYLVPSIFQHVNPSYTIIQVDIMQKYPTTLLSSSAIANTAIPLLLWRSFWLSIRFKS